MPKIQKPWDIIGTLSETFAKETGLKPGIPICAGAGDTMQSMIGCGSDQTRSGSRRSRNMCDVLYRNRWDQ